MTLPVQTPFCTIDEFLETGLPDKAISGETDRTIIQTCIVRATGLMVGYFKRYTLPLLEWDEGVKQCCIQLTARLYMRRRGFDPARNSDAVIEAEGAEAMVWLKQVADQVVNPSVIDSASPPNTVAAPQITSCPPQGWGLLIAR